ncbi:MAG: ABC transporter substrate-binding protein [Aeromicrobium sp.]
MKSTRRGRANSALRAVIALPLAGTLLLSACAGGDDEGGSGDGPIKVGVVAALTGIAAPYGVQSLNSFKLAVEDINEAGGIDGRDLEVVALDNRSKPEEVPALMRRLVGEDVNIILGASSTPLTATGAQAADQLKVPLLVPMEAGDVIIGEGRKYVFKLAPSVLADQGWAAQSVRAAAEGAEKAGDPIKTAFMIHASTGAYPEAKIAWERTLKEEYPDVDLIDTISFDEASTSDFGPLVAKAKAANPDLLIFGGNPQSAFQFYPALQDSGWQPKATVGALGGNTNAQFIPTVGAEAADGDIAGNYWTAELEAGENAKQTPQGFVDDYKEAYDGQVPDGVGAYYYSAGAVVAEALREVDDVNDKEAISKALREVDIAGINGDEDGLYIVSHGVEFDEKGFNAAAVGLVTQIQGGKYLPVFPADVATGEITYPKR